MYRYGYRYRCRYRGIRPFGPNRIYSGLLFNTLTIAVMRMLSATYRHRVYYGPAKCFISIIYLNITYDSNPQPFLHQGAVSWKTVFPWMGPGGGDGSGSNVSDGERWGATHEALLTHLPLTSCCAA